MKFEFDVIVIGAGHAGCEAAVASARLGAETLLITKDMNKVAQMSCNPAIGGIAKGQIVREIDALGGMMGIVADRTTIQFRMLNRSKGPAVWSPRAQSDRTKYIDEWRRILDSTPGLYMFQDTVTDIILDDPSDTESDGNDDASKVVAGVITSLGVEFKAKKVVLTAGTFLDGLMHFGPTKVEGGRIAEDSSVELPARLAEIGFVTNRMKTGTPARIDGRTIDFSKATRQDGDSFEYEKFSFLPEVRRTLPQRPCWIVHTNPEAHAVLTENMHLSPLYNGDISSIGPRYCPSIETKLVTFADKESHQLFLEPEGKNTEEYYINGFSSSMPWKVQVDALQRVEGLENVQMYRPGYAIEYTYFDPTQLYHTLETKMVSGLYFAGQVCGTTGYEEAAAQGLMAGINAALSVTGKAPLVLGRDQAYIGVLIDDLVTKGVDEPYRMFTSRAEYRILLRQDDADMRLTPIGYQIGLASAIRFENMKKKREERDSLIEFAKENLVKSTPEFNQFLEANSTTPLTASVRLIELIKRPQLSIKLLADVLPMLCEKLNQLESDRREEIILAAEILIKYGGYIERERELAEKQQRLENLKIPAKFDYLGLESLSTEARQKLDKVRPSTLGQASRIPGVSPADVNIIMLMIRQ